MPPYMLDSSKAAAATHHPQQPPAHLQVAVQALEAHHAAAIGVVGGAAREAQHRIEDDQRCSQHWQRKE